MDTFRIVEIVATAIIIPAFSWITTAYNRHRKAQKAQEKQIVDLRENYAKLSAHYDEQSKLLDKIDNKLDRLIERGK